MSVLIKYHEFKVLNMIKKLRVPAFGVFESIFLFAVVVFYSTVYGQFQIIGYVVFYVTLVFFRNKILYKEHVAPLVILYALFFYFLLNSILNKNLENGLSGFVYSFFVFSMSYLLSGFFVSEKRNKVINIITIGILFFLIRNYLLLIFGDAGFVRFSGVQGQPNSAGMSFSAISLSLLVFVFYLRTVGVGLLKALPFYALLLSVPLLFMTGSRGGMLAFLMPTMLITITHVHHISRTAKFFVFLFFLSFGVLLFVNFDIVYSSIAFNRLVALFNDLGISFIHVNPDVYIGAAEIESRKDMIYEVYELFRERPFIGYGARTFEAHSSSGFTYTHNNLAEIIFSYGAIGLLLYFLFIISFMRLKKGIFINFKKQASVMSIGLVIYVFVSGMSIPNMSNISMLPIYALLFSCPFLFKNN